MKKRLIISNIVISIFIVAAYAFAAEEKNILNAIPPTAIAPVATQPQTQQPAPAAQTQESTYSYKPLLNSDPFRPFIEVEITVKKMDEKKEGSFSIFPLQRVQTEQFRVVGIAGDQMRRVAVVEDATKKFYPLFAGTHIGLHNGKVIEIMADRVIVEEYVSKNAKRIILKLRNK
ncbi:MAG: pilus assembly protein PilP [Smithellaceae bacterium]|jgi:type IV pilus assembly protein PilP